MLTVSWFSAGVSSAVATKLAIGQIDKIIYTHIEDQHPDTMRFVLDCQEWFGKPVEILQSPLKSVENACRQMPFNRGDKVTGYINSPYGAACTRLLKRRVRKEWEIEKESPLRYCWGMDSSEGDRLERLKRSMPEQEHFCPLIERGIGKAEAHEILKASGIKRPAMYDLGYSNNNCVGCVKGGMGYWNKIRRDFPEVFEARAKLERLVGGTCLNGIYLDELDPEAGRMEKMILDDCGIFCELMGLK